MSKRKKIAEVEDAMKEIGKLQAENKELRRLWSQNENDIVKLNGVLTRFLRLKWYKRIFVKLEDERLYKDI